ncbi:MAG: hypothetical protein HRU03_01875 [Nanoarchaeales archaeon]|nr:hypothetical protein [Nanoarchaeales archaeon]
MKDIIFETNLDLFVLWLSSLQGIIFLLLIYKYPDITKLVFSIQVVLLPTLYISHTYLSKENLHQKYKFKLNSMNNKTRDLANEYIRKSKEFDNLEIKYLNFKK